MRAAKENTSSEPVYAYSRESYLLVRACETLCSKLKSARCSRVGPVAMARSAESLAAAGVDAAEAAQPVIRAWFGREDLEVTCVYRLITFAFPSRLACIQCSRARVLQVPKPKRRQLGPQQSTRQIRLACASARRE